MDVDVVPREKIEALPGLHGKDILVAIYVTSQSGDHKDSQQQETKPAAPSEVLCIAGILSFHLHANDFVSKENYSLKKSIDFSY